MIRLKQLLREVLEKEDTYTVILMTVIERHPGDIPVAKQQQIISTEIFTPHNIIVHDYDELNGVLSDIKTNPTSFVILFAEACLNAHDVATKLNNKRALFIAAPTEDPLTDTAITKAVASGVPKNHVIRTEVMEDSLKQAADGIQYLIDHPEILKPDVNAEKQKTDVPTININDFRRQWRALGHTIKVKPGEPGPDELSNGGPVDEVLLGIILEIFKEYKQPVNITGGNDTYHHGLSYISLHVKGKAVDIVPYRGRSTNLEALLDTYKTKYSNFAWDNEYTNPAKMATGPHYHLYLKGPVSTKTPKN